jgi:hypothetical protein
MSTSIYFIASGIAFVSIEPYHDGVGNRIGLQRFVQKKAADLETQQASTNSSATGDAICRGWHLFSCDAVIH